MTDLHQSTRDQSTRNQRTPPTRTLERGDPDWIQSEQSTHDSTRRDLAGSERPTDDDGTVYQSAAYESAVDEPVVDEPRVDAMAAYETGVEERAAAPSAGEAGHDRADPEHAVGMATVPDAEPASDSEAGRTGRGDLDSPGIEAQGAVRTDGPDRAYGINGHEANVAASAQAALAEPEAVDEHDGAAVVTETGQPVDDVDEHAERAKVAGRDAPLVPAAGDDAVASDATGSGELLPGHVPEEPGRAWFDGETTERCRDRWQQLQLGFVDDPHATAGLAGALVDEAVAALRDAVDRERSALEDWQSGPGVDEHYGDTERLRVAVRRYRNFLDRLLGM